MITKAQKVRLGIFIIFCSALILLLLVVVAGNRLLEKRDTYFIEYTDVSVNGLQVGGQVKYHGIAVGRVDDIVISKDDVSKVIVTITVDEGTPIKEDVEAKLVFVGITGLKQIELIGGTNQAKLQKPESYIVAGASTFDNISGKAEIITEKTELLLNNLNRLTGGFNIERFESILKNVDDLVDENKDEFTSIVTNLDSISSNLTALTLAASEITQKLNNAVDENKIENLLANSSKFSEDLAKADVDGLITDIREAVKQANLAFTHIDLTILKGRQDILRTLETLREATDYLNEFSRRISEDPRLLLREGKETE